MSMQPAGGVRGDPEIVELNVGGVHYSTTRTTLAGGAVEPGGTMLSAMFGGRLASRLDREGRVFIDRDGARFGYLLNYLRDGALTGGARAEGLLYELREEAAFFGFARLVAVLDAEIAQRDLEDELESMPSLSQQSFADADAEGSENATPPAAAEGEKRTVDEEGASSMEPLDYTFSLDEEF